MPFIDLIVNRSSKLFILTLSVLILGISGCDQKPKFNNVDISGSTAFSTNFSLPDHQGKMRSLSDFKGKVPVIFFGYTQCPDVCPSTMIEMQAVIELLGGQAKDIQVIFITVDPDRDTQEILAQYVPGFDPSFIGLRPQSQDELKALTKGFKVYYQKIPGKNPNSYTMDHTAGSYVFDRLGNIRLFVKHGQGGQALADDLKILLN
jgi:protein SCO1/2